MKELLENWRRYALSEDNHSSQELVDESLPSALATVGKTARATSKAADKASKVALKIKQGADIVGDVLPEDDEEEVNEWNAEDEKNGKYPSRKQRKRDKYMLKPEKGSWVPGARELATGGLTKGFVGMSESQQMYEEKLIFLESLMHDGSIMEGKQEQFEAYIVGVIERGLEQAIKRHMQAQGCSFNQFIRMLYAYNSAEKGRDTSSKN